MEQVIHIVDHPLRSIATIARSYSERDWVFVAARTPLVRLSMPLVQRALYHWITWNQWIENYSDVRYDLVATSPRVICLKCGYSADTCAHVPARIKAKCTEESHSLPHTSQLLTWELLDGLVITITLHQVSYPYQ